MMKKRILLPLAMGLVMLVSSACAPKAPEATATPTEAPATSAEAPTDAPPADAKKIKVGFAIKTQDSPYFVALVDSVKKQAEENGWECTVLDANGDTTKEASNMETFVAQKMDMIFLDSVDPDACVPSIDAAAAAGIGVINLDSGVSEEANDITTVYSDNKQNGRLVGLDYAKKMGDAEITAIVLSGAKGNVAGKERRTGVFTGIIEGKTGMTEEEAWKASLAFDDELLAKGKASFPDAKFSVVGQGWGSWTREDGLKAAEDLITANKTITTVIGENDQMLFGAMTALENAAITGVDIVAAADGAKEAYELIKEGKYFATGENSPFKVALKGFEIAKEILIDGKDPASYDEITMTTPNSVTIDNVDQFYDANSAF